VITKSICRLSALLTAMGSVLLANPMFAQQLVLEEVVVTASRRVQSVQDSPLSITALLARDLERDRVNGLVDIARVVPGMTVVEQGSRAGNRMTVRGLNADSLAAAESLGNSSGDTVGTYIGEIPLYLDLRTTDLARVEVLPGPQGTLYGAGTLGGAVRYIPKQPQADAASYELRGSIYDLSESYDLGYEAGATLNIPVVRDKLALRASIDYFDDPGFIDYNFIVREPGVSNPQPDLSDPDERFLNLSREEDANTDETMAARVAVRYVDETLDATLTYYYQDQDVGGRQINHADAFNTDSYESAHRFVEPNERENQLLALEVFADLGFAELVSATGLSKYEEQGQRDQTDLLLGFEVGFEEFPGFVAFTRDAADEERLNQELRLVSTSSSQLGWIVGAFYNRFEADTLSQEFTPGFDQFAVDNLGGLQLRPDALEYYEARKIDTRERAVFGELGYRFNDQWQLTVGGRFFDYKDERVFAVDLPLENTLFLGAAPDLIQPVVQRNKAEDDGALFKLNAAYNFSEQVMAFGTISEGYRLGGLNSVTPCDETPDPGEGGQKVCALADEVLIKPDTTTNYELGVHSDFTRGRLNASVYYIDWKDIQIADVTENGSVPIIGNGGEAANYGLELAGQWSLTDSLTLWGSYAYNHAQLTEDAPGLVNGIDGEEGDRLAGSPEHQGRLALNYVIGLSDGSNVHLDWSMTARSDVLTHTGKRDNGEALPGFALHNVSASWFRDDWVLTLYADNVLDRFAETSVRADSSFVRAVGGFDLRRYYKNVTRPRELGIRVIYRMDG